jgi:hypothetical protein
MNLLNEKELSYRWSDCLDGLMWHIGEALQLFDDWMRITGQPERGAELNGITDRRITAKPNCHHSIAKANLLRNCGNLTERNRGNTAKYRNVQITVVHLNGLA